MTLLHGVILVIGGMVGGVALSLIGLRVGSWRNTALDVAFLLAWSICLSLALEALHL